MNKEAKRFTNGWCIEKLMSAFAGMRDRVDLVADELNLMACDKGLVDGPYQRLEIYREIRERWSDRLKVRGAVDRIPNEKGGLSLSRVEVTDPVLNEPYTLEYAERILRNAEARDMLGIFHGLSDMVETTYEVNDDGSGVEENYRANLRLQGLAATICKDKLGVGEETLGFDGWFLKNCKKVAEREMAVYRQFSEILGLEIK